MIKVWIKLDDTSSKVKVDDGADVDDLKKAIKKEWANKLDRCDAADLRVYSPETTSFLPENSIGQNKTLKELIDEWSIDFDHPLIVVAPAPNQAQALVPPAAERPEIEFETTSFDELDERIVRSQDLTGTVQVGWRREQDKYYSQRLFLRPHLSELKEKLDWFMMKHHKKRRMYIAGPPGSGKTTYGIFYFTCYVMTNKGKKGLIVQYRERANDEIMVLDGKCIRRVRRKKGQTTTDLVWEVVEKEGGENVFDFCVFDGVRQNKQICEDIGKAITASVGEETKVIQITSLEFHIRGGDGTGGTWQGIDVFFNANSWKLVDYEEAVKAKLLGREKIETILCLDSDFGTDGKGEEAKDSEEEAEDENSEKETLEWLMSLLKRKYFYAGGSARFMFEYSMDHLIGITETKPEDSILGELFSRMTTEYWSSFAQLKISSATPASVSSGMQRIDGEYFPVSKYYLLEAHKVCKAQLTASVREAANKSNNPAFKGWAFELEQLDVIEHVINNTDPKTILSEDRSLVLPLGTGRSATFDGKMIEDVSGDVFTIWCRRWNQGCFDVAFYLTGHLITANFTISENHSLKINPIRDLKDALEGSRKEVHCLTHVAVVEDKCANFRFGEAEGAGRAVAESEFTIQTARSQKLVANATADQSPAAYGYSLVKVGTP